MPRQPPREGTSSGSTASCPSRGRENAAPYRCGTRRRFNAGPAIDLYCWRCCPCCSPPQCPSDILAVPGLPLAAHCDEVRNCHSHRRAPRGSNTLPRARTLPATCRGLFPFFPMIRCLCAAVILRWPKAAAWCCTGNLRRRTPFNMYSQESHWLKKN